MHSVIIDWKLFLLCLRFFCGRDVKTEYLEPDGWMLVPVVLLAGATVWMGIAPGGLVELGSSIVGMVL